MNAHRARVLAWLAIGALVVTEAPAAPAAGTRPVNKPAGAFVLKVVGKAVARPSGAGKDKPLRAGDAVEPGWTVQVGKASAVKLALPDGKIKALIAGTTYRVGSAPVVRAPAKTGTTYALCSRALARRRSKLIDTSAVTAVRAPGLLYQIELLAPGDTTIVSDQLVFRWAPPPGAKGYQVTFTERRGGRKFLFNTVEPVLHVDSQSGPLRAGGHYTWQVRAAAPLAAASLKSPFRVLSAAESTALDTELARVRRIARSDIDPAVRILLEGQVLQDKGLVGRAKRLYETALSRYPANEQMQERWLSAAMKLRLDPWRRMSEAMIRRMWGTRVWDKSATIAVSPLADVRGGTLSLGMLLADKLSASLTRVGCGKVVVRRQLDRILDEHDLSFSDLVDARKRTKVLKLLPAKMLLTGTTHVSGNSVNIAVRLIDVSTGAVLNVAEATVTPQGDSLSPGLLTYVQRPTGVRKGGLPPLSVRYTMFTQCKDKDGTWLESAVGSDRTEMRSGDQFKFHLSPVSDCRIYLLLFDSRGEVSCLFPTGRIKQTNVCRGGIEVKVPGGDRWFWLDRNTGRETLYLVASYGPLKELDALLVQMAAAGGGNVKLATRIRGVITDMNQKGDGKQTHLPGGFTIRGVGGIAPGKLSAATGTSGRKVHAIGRVISSAADLVHTITITHR